MTSETSSLAIGQETATTVAPVHFQIERGFAVIRMDNPPLNGLSWALRQELLRRLDQAIADPSVVAVVLAGTAKAFSCGADVKEFGTPQSRRQPTLTSLIRAFEDASKPTIAAISGMALGGGLELAMGCHFRVSQRDARLGLPEIKLGLMPGAGGTQRLPRLVGLDRALNMILTGAAFKAVEFNGTRMVDEITDGDVVETAIAYAQRVASEGRPLPRTRQITFEASHADALLAFARQAVKGQKQATSAPERCIEALQAACRESFDTGMAVERRAFDTLMLSPESRALQHAFKAEREAARMPGLAVDSLPPIRTVGVVGAGTMGRGIALTFLDAGLSVRLLEMQQSALDKGVSFIHAELDKAAAKGRLDADALQARKAALLPTLEYEAFSDVDLAIEAVFEDIGVKQTVFEALDSVLKPGAILASNTSALNLDEIARFTRRPSDVVGLHFFSPAHVMRLLEVVRGKETRPAVLAAAMQLAKRIGKVAVVAGVCDGFIGNRMVARYLSAANEMLCQGATPTLVDSALERFGMAMGVFRMGDLAGLDIGWAGRKRRAAAYPDQDFSVVADRLCEAGRFGQKTGAGWYRYESGRRDAIPDPAVEDIIRQWRSERGWTPRTISSDEVVEACIFALVNEGARILEEGIAARASDIDVVYLNGYGFPRHRGGPMWYADQVGLPMVVRTLRRIASQPGVNGAFWTPAPLLVRMAEEGRSFN
ncbi:3-hydroxyacyl-CoA dehydrogenase [Paraburkholderia piptadeniae]|uniref:3-hydroxyacyl-CoA dehydrogenase n=1 Tax=Paraburkholderia piptadeniae TaxID=1701573 RepID=A0A1N7SE83_9BURK|nr:3-hydroxyacyl-CoA dehydrogenase NAD-binding domain-containing protein [Paraburkholderia piptadeniae]SIT45650.1 3-hydroxyacyl-CoA dehydrogenase [Paraburkholderia piptadeniae]